MDRPENAEKGPAIDSVKVGVYTVPTDDPESDGTLEWSSTTMITAWVSAGGKTGLGYTYSQRGAAYVIKDILADLILQQDCFNIARLQRRMLREVRNFGPGGIAFMAVGAVDSALWDLKARVLELPLARLLGVTRSTVPVYGSGGFLSYSLDRLQEQLGSWASLGMEAVKMKIGADLAKERERLAAAREAIGPDVELFVDANGALTVRQAIPFCQTVCRDYDISWFEEPVSSENIHGLRFIREHAGPRTDIAAGEYGFDPPYFLRLLESRSVDVLQADATRCGGPSGFLQADALCEAFQVPLSAHTAPGIHLAPCCSALRLRHLEYFHDHVRIEKMLFDGFPEVMQGMLKPDLSRPGHGLEWKEAQAKAYAVE